MAKESSKNVLSSNCIAEIVVWPSKSIKNFGRFYFFGYICFFVQQTYIMCLLWTVCQGLLSEAEFQFKENPLIECSDVVHNYDTVWRVLVLWEHKRDGGWESKLLRLGNREEGGLVASQAKGTVHVCSHESTLRYTAESGEVRLESWFGPDHHKGLWMSNKFELYFLNNRGQRFLI